MGVRFYDEAVSNKIANWVKDPNLRILKPDEATRLFEMTADRTGDTTLTLPLIAISRNRDIDILTPHKQPKTFDGYSYEKNYNVSIPINVIPIQLGYQIDVYAKGMAEADEYIRNFVFNFINYPKLIVELPYNDVKFKHEAIISLESNITDNSDIQEHLFADQFVRFTLKITLTDAYLFSIPIKDSVHIEELVIKIADNASNPDEIPEEEVIYEQTVE